jgi:hypothetical protein
VARDQTLETAVNAETLANLKLEMIYFCKLVANMQEIKSKGIDSAALFTEIQRAGLGSTSASTLPPNFHGGGAVIASALGV